MGIMIMKLNIRLAAGLIAGTIIVVCAVFFLALPGAGICNSCLSRQNVLPIVYGMPGYELARKEERGEIILGGCISGKGAPHWHCKKCNRDW